MEEMRVEYLRVGELIPYENNAKDHPPEQVEHIANSIKEFGFRQPLVVDADNVVVIGHGRLLAAKRLGLDKVPCVRADDLTEAQIKALRLADNKTNESAWNFEALNIELEELDAAGLEIVEFGFEGLGTGTEPIPENLDADDEWDEDKPVSVKLTFPNFTEYRIHETEVKEAAKEFGATFAVIKV